MTEIPQELREAVRRAYGYRCGYCGVHENEVGNLRMRQEIIKLSEQLDQANERVNEIEEELQRILDLLR